MTRDPDDVGGRFDGSSSRDGSPSRDGSSSRDNQAPITDDALDERVRVHLRAGVPGHRAGFWEDLAATLETTPQETSQESSRGVQGTVIPFRPSPRTGTPGTAPVGGDADGDKAMTIDMGTRGDRGAQIPGTDEATDLGGGDRWTSGQTARGRRHRGWWATAAAAAVVLATATGVGLALRGAPRPDDVATTPRPSDTVVTAPATDRPTTSASSSPSASGVVTADTSKPTATHPVGATFAVDTMNPAVAVKQLSPLVKGGILGKPKYAWSWTDGSHRHVMLATMQEQTSSGPDGNGATYVRLDGATTRIYYAYGATGKALTLARTMTDDNGGYCDVDFGADITYGTVSAFDADGDGLSEVTVGWDWMCRGDPGPVDVKLAMLSGTKKFILRGTGVLVASDPIEGITMPPATFTADPAPQQWPGRSYQKTVALFHQIWK